MIRNLDVFLWNRKAGSFCVPILQGRATGFMHPDAAPAPDARRAKKPPIHSGWERTEKQDTKDWRRTYLTGFGNSNVFSIIFSQALLAVPEKKNEVSGLMIMGLFGGTVFPLLMGFAGDAMGQSGAVGVMLIGVLYLIFYTPRIRRPMAA